MDIFEYGKALTDFWTLGGKALLSGQENAYRTFATNMEKMATASRDMAVPNLQMESADLAAAGQAFMALWTSAAELSTLLNAKIPEDTNDEAAAALVFRKMFDPRAWMSGTGDLDDMLQRMAEGPRFADFWETERKFARVFQAWLKLRRASLEHTTVVLEAWVKAASNFSEQLAGFKRHGKHKNAKEVLTLWVDLANQRLLETQSSERFLRTQSALLAASTDLRFAQREVTEYYGSMFGFPTRTELDDVHKTVTELKRELRTLKREMRPYVRRSPVQSGPPAIPANAHVPVSPEPSGETAVAPAPSEPSGETEAAPTASQPGGDIAAPSPRARKMRN